jgi:hypothetical protein
MKTSLSSADGRREPLEEDEKVTVTPRAETASAPAEKIPELTVQVGRAIVAAIAAGNFPRVAARLAGVSMATLEKWLERGDKGEKDYADFAEAYRRADADNQSEVVASWKKAALEDPRAAGQYLARRYPESWSDHAARRAVEGPEGNAYGNSGDATGLHITLLLGTADDPPLDPLLAARTVEIEDHRTREREIEHTELLATTAIKDKV